MDTYKLKDAEDVLCELELPEPDVVVAKVSDEMRLEFSGWPVYIPSLDLLLREGTACIYDEDEKDFLPDFSVTAVYQGRDADPGDWLYYEQDGMVVTMANFMHGRPERLGIDQIGELDCEILVGQQATE